MIKSGSIHVSGLVSLSVGGRNLTIATIAKLISVRNINDTKNPDHDKKYNTTRAGMLPETNFLI